MATGPQRTIRRLVYGWRAGSVEVGKLENWAIIPGAHSSVGQKVQLRCTSVWVCKVSSKEHQNLSTNYLSLGCSVGGNPPTSGILEQLTLGLAVRSAKGITNYLNILALNLNQWSETQRLSSGTKNLCLAYAIAEKPDPARQPYWCAFKRQLALCQRSISTTTSTRLATNQSLRILRLGRVDGSTKDFQNLSMEIRETNPPFQNRKT
ncbi:uncharacterized protein LACBIDRAFT_327971 [Laccaria bicolor S238N-H82]|uniref:Predicted protein n=1 Tax=Laccaria bicolor (strain S238N-H82 / ATCC MYA-4686) TaxID=486041 RepID=B0DDE3_LACBS|nr:uncharacterized protein LACBIDRAFT_327971 [Laccaria bicolor S238N-H82]EDR07461.1 predicted protein [Laccaria bicolor S238N-H82]|eukprot:XP_001881853.1 predicted protein [Laccaria bicolor S238N-H82]